MRAIKSQYAKLNSLTYINRPSQQILNQFYQKRDVTLIWTIDNKIVLESRPGGT